MTVTTTRLPAPTDDLDRSEHDLATHGICAVTDVLTGDALAAVHDDLYHAAAQDRARGGSASSVSTSNTTTPTSGCGTCCLARRCSPTSPSTPWRCDCSPACSSWPMLLGNLSANITGPGGGEMVLHADKIFVPLPWPAEPQGASAAWCVDDFTADSGSTCFVPGSHLLHRLPEPGDDVTAVPMEAPAGSLVVFESRLWHRTGFNRTADQRRAGIFGWYTCPIYRTQENFAEECRGSACVEPSRRCAVHRQVRRQPCVDIPRRTGSSPSTRRWRNASDDLLTLLADKSEGLGLVNGTSPL